MSKITLSANASGTAIFTVAAPATSTNQTLTLPDATATLVGDSATQTLTNKSIAGSQLTGTVASSLLTGALPALDGSALTGISSMILLGTLTTTSGATQTLSGLTLTNYKFITAVFTGVSFTSATAMKFGSSAGPTISQTIGSISNVTYGIFQTDLATGVLFSSSFESTGSTNSSVAATVFSGVQNTVTTASTSITFAPQAGSFDAGSILVYGVK